MYNVNDFKRIHDSFSRQGLMKTLGASVESVEQGQVVLVAPFQESLTQQHGFFHGGVITSLLDVACGYAALSAAPEDCEVLTVEFKINFLKPGKARELIAVGRVIQSDRTLTICDGMVYDETREKVIAKMTATMIVVKASN